MVDRDLVWEGCCNVRDLGGLPTADGRSTRWGAVVRADNPAFLTAAGWSALHRHGVRTIVALRTVGLPIGEADGGEDLHAAARAPVPDDVAVEVVFVEDATDPDFVATCVASALFCTPLYFAPMLERWPQRCAAAVAAVAEAPPGGVVISCGRGCDRTGLTAFLVLALAGVDAGTIAADWAVSIGRLQARAPEHGVIAEDVLAREGTTVAAAVEHTLATYDVEERLLAGGLDPAAIAAVRARLVGGPV